MPEQAQSATRRTVFLESNIYQTFSQCVQKPEVRHQCHSATMVVQPVEGGMYINSNIVLRQLFPQTECYSIVLYLLAFCQYSASIIVQICRDIRQ